MQPTSTPAHVVADTIVRTVELGVTITDPALDGETTVVFCDLLTLVQGAARAAAASGPTATPLNAGSAMCRWPDIRWCCGSGSRVIAARTTVRAGGVLP